MDFTLSLAQIDIRKGNLAENLAKARQYAGLAAAQHSQLLLFPELWTTGYDLERARQVASPLGEGYFQEISQIASGNGIWLGGSCLEKSDDKIFNSFTLYNPSGKPAGLYRKLHLFRLMSEEVWLFPGQEMVSLDLPWGKTGLCVCYDLRFPELLRSYALNGCVVILICAEWPLVRIDHWKTLIRARAIENQCYVAAVNRTGVTDGLAFGGSSMIVDPWGEVLTLCETEEGLLTATLQLEKVEQIRKSMPIYQDRRPDIYG